VPTVLLTQCLQVDFAAPIRADDELPNQLHIGFEEARRLLGDEPAASPLAQLMAWARGAQGVHVVHIRDHHDAQDPRQQEHLRTFGPHCLQGTPGARLLLGWDEGRGPREHVVLASGLNDFEGTTLGAVLDGIQATAPGEPMRAAVIGVWTDAKVSFLLYDLKTRRGVEALAVSSALTASRSRERHFQALDHLRTILGVTVFDSTAELAAWLEPGAALAPPPGAAGAIGPRVTLSGAGAGTTLAPADAAVVAHLFRDAREVDLLPLAGGFSGASVYRAASTDEEGHRQADTVLKLGPPKEIGRERAGTERMAEILGNTVPRVKGYVDVGGRAGLRFAWASMGVGGVRTLKSLFEKGQDDDEVVRVVDAVFDEVLAPLYAAAVYDRLPLLAAYGFAQFADGVRPKVAAIVGDEAARAEMLALPGGRSARNVSLFYERDARALAPSKSESHFVSRQHGDLNWANILRDGRGNVWVIDFARSLKGHVLMDTAKLENDLLYILTPLEDEAALEAAVAMSFALRGVQDLRAGLAGIAPPEHPALRRTWRVLERLRARTGLLCREDRHPIQLHTALLRYAVHTLGFDESSPRHRRWALAAACVHAEEIRATLLRDRALRVDWVEADAVRAPGRLGMTICPGRVDKGRALEEDLKALQAQGASRIVCLLGDEELARVGVLGLPEAARALGLAFDRRPIADQGVPTLAEARAWADEVRAALARGESVVVHCMGGLGRTGAIVACALARGGLAPAEAIAAARQARGPRCLETPGQERLVSEVVG